MTAKKRLLSIFVAVMMVFMMVPGTAFAEADPDTVAPVIDVNSISVTLPEGKESVTVGDMITISFDVSDDRYVDTVDMEFLTPVTSNTIPVYLQYTGTDETRSGTWAGTYTISENDENGIWRIRLVGAYDGFNVIEHYNSKVKDWGDSIDLSAFDFEVVYPECPLDLTDSGYSMMLDGAGATTTFGGNYYVTQFDETVTPEVKVRYDDPDGTWTTLSPRKYTLNYEKKTGEDSWEDYTNSTFGIGTYRVSAAGKESLYYTGTIAPVEFNVIKKCKVTFDTLGGDGFASQYVIPGETAEDPGTPARDGYFFGGWYADEELSEPFDFHTAINDDITIYAGWLSEITLTIGVYDQTNGVSGQGGSYTFNDEDMFHIAGKHTVTIGSSVKLVAAPAEGYWFKGWFLGRVTGDGDTLTVVPEGSEGFADPVLDLTAEVGYVLCAVFKENTDVPPEIDISTLQVDVPEEREEDRIVTAGDNINVSVKITDNGNIKKALAYLLLDHENYPGEESYIAFRRVVLSRNDGDIWTGVLKIDEGTETGEWEFGYVEAEDNNSNRACYYNNAGYYEEDFSPNADLSEFNFTVEKSYTVTFISNGGSDIPSQTVIAGKKAVEPDDPTRDGWHFNEWFTDEDLTEEYWFGRAVNEDITLYAGWYTYMALGVYNKSNPDTWPYNYQCGTVDMVADTAAEWSKTDAGTMNYTAPEGSITYTAKPAEGYVFKGWYWGIIGESYFVEAPSEELLSEEAVYICASGDMLALCAVFECAGHQWEQKIQKATPDAAGRIYQTCKVCGIEENIAPLPQVSSITLEKTSYTYTGKAIEPKVTVANASEELSADCYDVEYFNNVNTGTATAKVTLKGDYYEGSKELTFKINKASQTVTVSKTSYTKTYGDAAFSLGAKTNGDGTLKYSSDNTKVATVSTAGKVTIKGVGTAKITVYATAGTNYKQSADQTVTVKVNKADQTVTVKASASSVAVGNTATLETTAKGTVTYSSADSTIATVNKTTGVITAKKIGTVKITAAAAATAEYNKGSKTITIKVVPAATTEFKATNTASGIKLTWKKVEGATKYCIERNGEDLKTVGSGTLSYTDKTANVNGKKYVYKIKAYASTGKGAGKSVTRYFVSRPTLSSAASTTAKKATVKWKKVAKTSGYQIQYSTSGTFESGNKTVTVEGGSVISKVIESLTSGKTYYVRVRAYKKAGSAKHYSAWSTKLSVKIK